MKRVTELWNERLWAEVERLAAGLDGATVIRVLAETSDTVWAAGLDHAFIDLQRHGLAEMRMSLGTAVCFDNTWLSVFAANLARAKKAKR